MSKTSAKQRYTAFTEWHSWAKTKYPAFRNATKKKKPAQPRFSEYGQQTFSITSDADYV